MLLNVIRWIVGFPFIFLGLLGGIKLVHNYDPNQPNLLDFLFLIPNWVFILFIVVGALILPKAAKVK